jgi:aryl-alcohol dehydrogenase-like predicted oxidoreductase
MKLGAQVTNYDAERLAEAADISRENGLPEYQCLQPHYNLLERRLFEGPVQNECQGIGVIPYYPLAAGFLSGKYRSPADLSKSRRGASDTGTSTTGG